jgi:hypothetical protein
MSSSDSAIRALEDRLFEIYHRAGREVTYRTEAGDERPYWPKRYLQALRRAVEQGDDELVEFASRLVTSEHPSRGFGYLDEADRLDLTVEAVVADSSAPYHARFDDRVIRAARRRLREHGFRPQPARSPQNKGHRFNITVEVESDGRITISAPDRSPETGGPLDAVRFFIDELNAAGRTGKRNSDPRD